MRFRPKRLGYKNEVQVVVSLCVSKDFEGSAVPSGVASKARSEPLGKLKGSPTEALIKVVMVMLAAVVLPLVVLWRLIQ